MKKLSIPANIPLRWEVWRGFGRPELLKTAVITGAALAAAVAWCQVTRNPSAAVIATVTVVFAFAFCTGLFGQMEGNQSIYDFFVRQMAYKKEQQQYQYTKIDEVILLEAETNSKSQT